MFRVMEVDSSGAVTITPGDSRVGNPAEGIIRWVDLVEQDDGQLAILADRFHFHPLTIEDCAHFGQRPKLEEYGDYLFLVTHGFCWPSRDADDVRTLELHTFLAQRCLVTVHALSIPPLDDVWQRVARDGSLARRGPDWLCYLIADAVVDDLFPLLDQIASDVEEVEETVLSHATGHELADIFRLKRLLVRLRRVLGPQRDTFALLAKRGDVHVPERTALYFRDVYDHVLRINESLDATRDLLGNALDAYLWSASQRTNEIMKRLTLLSAIFLPLGFITGFFGQNFQHLPFASRLMFAAMLASCLAVPAGMLYFFLRSKWF